MRYGVHNCVTEWSFVSGKAYEDPFNEVQLNMLFTNPYGEERTVPAFWAGEHTWRVRHAPSVPGIHRYRTFCSDMTNADLHGQQGTLQVAPYDGDNPLLRHGRLRVASDRRHLQHQDGTPFFWLGDTWWMGLCKRLSWPEGFRELMRDRVDKGFTVIQIVAGLYPDMEPFDERGANEAGFPWETDFSVINPSYFDMADLRIADLIQSGLVACIVGSWGFFLEHAGMPALKRHWANLVARYAAYPVVWCVAGEALMDFYLQPTEQRESPQRLERMRSAWSEMIRFIRGIDPYSNPITVHPTRYGHDQVDDPSLMDIDMLQTGHSGHTALTTTVNMVTESLGRQPVMPVLVGEVGYEGILESNREEMQRFFFWSCLLSGAAGHTYGANGIWQLNTRDQPYGLSPHGTSWGNTPWDEAYRLPGSGQIGLAKRLLEQYDWWRFEPHPEWIEPHTNADDRLLPYAAGIPGSVRVIFVPAVAIWAAWRGEMKIEDLEPGLTYHGFYFNPKDGQNHDLGDVVGDAHGEYIMPKPPVLQDWVIVLDRASSVVP